MSGQWMIYGAYGFTGRLIASLAAHRGERPVLAGRDTEQVTALARSLDLPARVFSLDDPREVRAGLEGMKAVVHSAGPFSATSRPMVDGCLTAGVHYLDVTGEIDVFESVFERHQEAVAAGVALIPGVGFDVVPTDCLAAMLAARLEAPTHLEIAFAGLSHATSGTMKSSFEGLIKGGKARVGGHLADVPLLWNQRVVAYHDKERWSISIPWGDVATAYRSTKIPNITVYMSAPAWMRFALPLVDAARPLLRLGPVQRTLKGRISKLKNPNDAQRMRGRGEVWAEVRSADRIVTGTLTTPEPYNLTADSSVRAVQRVLSGDVPAGALTPSLAFGPDFVMKLEGVVVHPCTERPCS